MTRRRLSPIGKVIVGFLLAGAVGLPEARAVEPIPTLYVATTIDRPGGAVTVLVPRPADRLDLKKPGDAALKAFDLLKTLHPTEYGKATLSLDADPARVRRATLNLDPERRQAFDQVAAEVFYTLSSLGVPEVRAPLLQDGPIAPASLRTPAFLLVVPYYDALPPREVPGSLVVLASGETLPAARFADRIRQGDAAMVEDVLSGLKSPSEAVRATVLAAIPSLPVANRPARVLPLLQDPAPEIRLAALKQLEAAKSPEINDRLSAVVEGDQDPRVKLAAVRVLSARGVKKYDVFLQMERLSDPDEAVVVDAIAQLAKSRNPVVGPSLAQALKHPAAQVRAAARDGLIAIGARELMVRAMPDDAIDLPTREAFAQDLAKNGSPEQRFTGWSWMLARGSEAAAIEASDALAKARPTGGLPALATALRRPEPAVRKAAAEGIAAWRDPAGLGPLLAAAKDAPDRAVFEDAAIRIIAGQSLDTILALMEDPDATIRRLAMKALGDALQGATPPPKAVAVLQARLADSDLGIRRAAVYALARMPDPAVSAAIMARIDDPDPEIREAAVVAAARTPGAQAETVLVEALNDESDGVKKVALDAIASRRIQSARDALRILAGYRDTEVRRKVVNAFLALLGPGEAVAEYDLLTTLLYDKDPEIKQRVIPVFATIQERRAMMMLSGLVIDPSPEVKLAVIDALAATGKRDAMEGIQKAIFDESPLIRIAALQGLERLGLKEAIPFLEELLNLEQDEEVRTRAAATRDALRNR
jgi:HEAT repeat protein